MSNSEGQHKNLIDYKAFEHMIDLFKYNKFIQFLDLSHNLIGDEGFKLISRSLRNQSLI